MRKCGQVVPTCLKRKESQIKLSVSVGVLNYSVKGSYLGAYSEADSDVVARARDGGACPRLAKKKLLEFSRDANCTVSDGEV